MASVDRKKLKGIFSPNTKYGRITPDDFEDLLDSVYIKLDDLGPTGATGATGPIGPTGETGPTGPTGFANIPVVATALSPTSSGETGELKTDGSYLYVATGASSWIRFGPGATNF